MLFNDIDTERNVLAILLMHPDPAKVQLSLLREEFFEDEQHKILFNALKDIHAEHADYSGDDEILRAWYDAKGLDFMQDAACLEDIKSRRVAVKHSEAYCAALEERYRASKAVNDMQTLLYPNGSKKMRERDPRKVIEGIGKIASEAVLSNYRNRRRATSELCAEHIQRIDELANCPETDGLIGVPTGFKQIDAITGGIRSKHPMVIAARPGVGKTSKCLQIGSAAADAGHPPLLMSLEMDSEAVINRLAGQLTGIDIKQIERGKFVSDRERERVYQAIKVIGDKWEINDSPGRDIDELLSTIRAELLKKQYGLLIIDHLQMIRGRQYRKRHEAVAEILQDISDLSDEYHLPVLLLCQLNRCSEKDKQRAPRLSDLKESGSIEELAGVVMMLHRPNMLKKDADPSYTEILIPKNRFGEMAMFRARFHGPTTKFYIGGAN